MLIILLGAAGFYLIYTPITSELEEKQAELDTKSSQMTIMQSTIATKDTVVESNEDAHSTLAEYTGVFGTYAYDEVLDDRIAEIIEANNLVIESVGVNHDAAKELDRELEDLVFKIYTLEVLGSWEDCANFMDEIYGESDMGIVTVSYDLEEEDETQSQIEIEIVVGMEAEVIQ